MDFIIPTSKNNNMVLKVADATNATNATNMSNLPVNAIPTLCFITMCKNEEHCIQQTLESVYKHIDYWVVCDTGSTDNIKDDYSIL